MKLTPFAGKGHSRAKSGGGRVQLKHVITLAVVKSVWEYIEALKFISNKSISDVT